MIISCILLGVFFAWIDVNELKGVLKTADYRYLSVALVLMFINRVLMPVKWNILLIAKDIHIAWFDAIRIYYISSFMGLYLPPTVGADSIRVYYTSKKKYPVSDIVASIIVERIIGFLALIFFIIIGCFILSSCFTDMNLKLHNLIFTSLTMSFLFVLFFFVSLNNFFIRIVETFLEKLFHRKWIGKSAVIAHKLFQSYACYKTKKHFLILFYVLTCIEVLMPVIISYIIAGALNVSVPLSFFFAFVPIVLFLIRLPISIDGFGINEGGYIYFLSLMGVPETLGFGVGIINHFILLIGLLPGVFFYAFDKYKDYNQTKQKMTIPDTPIIQQPR
ncbi:MAG: lysylphosphatidylglycerol synthase transmembrane domain-containing protein [Desulfobacterales bacterium]|nr:lysylphosphatidylglycerol synthase transmembrane domain-containing protein [Desulfobacterales bacterium]MDD4072955.1 lysylphosphatidylglycerol synthase transmembrane domain-containing protein [Desulfobacterales bacterium]MDD4392772.1 lysylphosphatidylglycerol synthase transmembrane domain-containing protein [Desulfobacterales bacterium]